MAFGEIAQGPIWAGNALMWQARPSVLAHPSPAQQRHRAQYEDGRTRLGDLADRSQEALVPRRIKPGGEVQDVRGTTGGGTAAEGQAPELLLAERLPIGEVDLALPLSAESEGIDRAVATVVADE